MARASNPRLMMLDEPASGLSRGERVALSELLLELDPAITLILIEHDMDVALRVADRVTMMHDGAVIVEGTPAEIRANQTVHDLYLGRGNRGDELVHDSAARRREPERVLRDCAARSRTSRSRSPAAPTSMVGRNGMGKTTLCNAIVGIPPARVTGSIRYQGRELVGRPSYKIAKLGIGYVPQGRRLFPSLSVDEHLRMIAGRGGSGKRWTPERVYELFPRLARA